MKLEFNINDEVVALTESTASKTQPRVKGKKYIVQDVMYCSNCGEQCINIGVPATFKKLKCECGEIQDSKGKSWTSSIHFSNVNNIEKEMFNAAKKEDYNRAIVLRDVIKIMNS